MNTAKELQEKARKIIIDKKIDKLIIQTLLSKKDKDFVKLHSLLDVEHISLRSKSSYVELPDGKDYRSCSVEFYVDEKKILSISYEIKDEGLILSNYKISTINEFYYSSEVEQLFERIHVAIEEDQSHKKNLEILQVENSLIGKFTFE